MAIVLAVLVLANDRQETKSRELDLSGFALFSPGLVLFLYALDHLSEHIGPECLLVSVVLLAVFFRIAIRKGDGALVDLQLFKSKTFSASAITQFMSNGISVAGQMLIPIYLIRACGQSPTTSLNIVQRLGGPILTTLCATFLGWRLMRM